MNFREIVRFNSIRKKILAGTVLILSFTVLLSGALSYLRLKSEEEERAHERLGAMVTEVQRFLDRDREGLKAKAKMVSVLPIIRAVLDSGDKSTIEDTLKSYASELHLDSVEAFSLEGKSLGQAGSVTKSLSAYAEGVLKGNPETLESLDGIFPAESQPLLISISPIGVGDHVNGFLLVSEKIDDKMVATLMGLTGAKVEFTLASSGPLHISPEKNEAHALSHSGFFPTLVKEKGLNYRFSLDNVGAFEKFRKFQVLLLALAAIILLIAMAFASFFSRMVAQPVVRLNEFTKKIVSQKGAISAERIGKTGEDEISELTVSINHFLDEIESRQKLLEKYNAELEEKVRDRTEDLNRANADLSALLDNLGQGFFTFDPSGNIQSGGTKVTREIFGQDPTGWPLWKALGAQGQMEAQISKWIRTCFSEMSSAMLDFNDLLAFGPREYFSTSGLEYSVEFRPLRDANGQLSRMICILTDITEKKRYEQISRRQAETVHMVAGIIGAPLFYSQFQRDLDRAAGDLEKEVVSPDPRRLGHILHTIKGLAATVHLGDAKDIASDWEGRAQEMEKTGKALDVEKLRVAAHEIRASVDRFQVELVRFGGGGKLEDARFSKEEINAFHNKLVEEYGAKSPLAVQFHEQFLLTDLRSLLKGMGEVVQYAAARSGKRATFEVIGERIAVEGKQYERISEVFTHMIRNSVDHGIEIPEERQEKGKPPEGKISIACTRKGNQVELKISDDGRGIDPAVLRHAATQNGFLAEEKAMKLSDRDVLDLIFLSGFSTKSEVTEISGRGIGMNFVKSSVESLGGSVEISSRIGVGTSIAVHLPLMQG